MSALHPDEVAEVLDAARERLRDFMNVVRAHDAVHPDRNACGGVGGCLLMRVEHDACTRLTDAIEFNARSGVALKFEASGS